MSNLPNPYVLCVLLYKYGTLSFYVHFLWNKVWQTTLYITLRIYDSVNFIKGFCWNRENIAAQLVALWTQVIFDLIPLLTFVWFDRKQASVIMNWYLWWRRRELLLRIILINRITVCILTYFTNNKILYIALWETHFYFMNY